MEDLFDRILLHREIYMQKSNKKPNAVILNTFVFNDYIDENGLNFDGNIENNDCSVYGLRVIRDDKYPKDFLHVFNMDDE